MLKQLDTLQFGAFTLDQPQRQLWREGQALPITGKAFDLLAFMAQNAGRPLSKTELLDTLWPDNVVEEANLSQNVFLLRKILGSGPDSPIKTLPGRGYQFVAQVIRVDPSLLLDDSPIPTSTPRATMCSVTVTTTLSATDTRLQIESEEETPGQAFSRRKRAMLLAALALVLAAGAAVGWVQWQHWLDRTAGAPVQMVLGAIDGTTGDPALDSALVDVLRMDLSQSPFVSVVAAATVRSTLTQMMHKPDDVLTPALARDLCERTNSQVVVHGAFARAGQRFLLTDEATSCADGSTLAEVKREVSRVEDLPNSIDKIAATLRQKLGESRRSVARFDAQLLPANTASLDALKAYSESTRLAEQGKLPQAIDLLRQAVAADPSFAIAWNDLAAYYSSSSVDPVKEREAMLKAWSLRDKASPLERMAITARYNMVITGDMFAAKQNYAMWTQFYPRKLTAWNGLSIAEGELGETSVAASTQALALRPHYVGLYANLAQSQMRDGDAQGARATCERAIAQGLDGDHLRVRFINVAYLLHDDALLRVQREWVAAHPDASSSLVAEAGIAMAEGRFAEARRITEHAAALMRAQGVSSGADSLIRGTGNNLIELGDVENGTRMLRSSPPDPENADDLMALAEIGDVAAAATGLQAMDAQHPQATLWKLLNGPLVRAAIATANHKPGEAAAQLMPTNLLEGHDLNLPLHRGNAYLAAGQPALAEKEYRYVLAHQGFDPVSSDYSLGWLGLGRALAAEGQKAEAEQAYQHFLKLWEHADPDATLLAKAQQELSALTRLYKG